VLDIYFCLLDAGKSDGSIILQSAFMLADIVQNSRPKYWPCVMIN